jgi:hypothetical protein
MFIPAHIPAIPADWADCFSPIFRPMSTIHTPSQDISDYCPHHPPAHGREGDNPEPAPRRYSICCAPFARVFPMRQQGRCGALSFWASRKASGIRAVVSVHQMLEPTDRADLGQRVGSLACGVYPSRLSLLRAAGVCLRSDQSTVPHAQSAVNAAFSCHGESDTAGFRFQYQ